MSSGLSYKKNELINQVELSIMTIGSTDTIDSHDKKLIEFIENRAIISRITCFFVMIGHVFKKIGDYFKGTSKN